MSGELARYGAQLVQFRGALVRKVEVREVDEFQIAESGADEGYFAYLVFADPAPYSIEWRFIAYSVPDRLVMNLSTGEVIDTGFIGRAIGKPSRVSGTLESTGSPLEWIYINAFIMPGFSGTIWDILIKFILPFPDD